MQVSYKVRFGPFGRTVGDRNLSEKRIPPQRKTKSQVGHGAPNESDPLSPIYPKSNINSNPRI